MIRLVTALNFINNSYVISFDDCKQDKNYIAFHLDKTPGPLILHPFCNLGLMSVDQCKKLASFLNQQCELATGNV